MSATQRFRFGRLSIVVLAMVAAACSSDASTIGDESELVGTSTAFEAKPTISLVVNDWTASAVEVAIAEQLIERHLGYPVVPVRLDDAAEMYERLADGSLDAVLEIWPSNMSDRDRLYFDRGQVRDAGPLGSVGKIGWFVPRYVIENEPSLAGWEGFRDPDVAIRFATETSEPKGRLLGTNPDYQQYDQEIIDNLALPLQVEFSGSEEETLAELAVRTAAAEPILLYWWTPTSAVARFDLVNVALPEPTDACAEAMATGSGRVDCDYPTDELFKATSQELQAKAPDVAAFIDRFTLSTTDQLALLLLVEDQQLTIDAAAAAWIDDNEDLWRQWLDS